MLANEITLGIISIILLFIANRLHFGYNCGLHTLADRAFDLLGILAATGFCVVFIYNHQTLYAIPEVAFFISACVLVRYKTRKKFCLPFWRTVRFAIITFLVFGGAGYALELLMVPQNEPDIAIMIEIIVAFTLGIIIMVAMTNCVFNHILNRRRVSSYYY